MTKIRSGSDLTLLWRAGLLTALVDGLFAVVLNVLVFRSTTFMRLWQTIASVPLGRRAYDGGVWTAAFGLLVHCGVAFFWAGLFLFLVRRLRWLSDAVASPHGVAKVASVYGPLVWMMMSLVAIPLVLHRAPTITPNWWVLLVGHFPFVGLPIVAMIGDGSGVAARYVATTSPAV